MAKPAEPKVFNITKNRPKVLLLGNGLSYSDSIPWKEFIKRVSREDVELSQYEKPKKDGSGTEFQVPNNVLTLATSKPDDNERHKKYESIIENFSYNANEKIKKLVSLPWDAILTTNYSYEVEFAQKSAYPKLSKSTKNNYAYRLSDKEEGKYLLQTYNCVSPKAVPVWHIHGEARRPSSIILSHDEYARIIHKIMEINKKHGYLYLKNQTEVKFKSWVDYFILGDIFILGLSMDFSEFDLWWLLGRRLREKTGRGKIIFYEPEKDENQYKYHALLDSGIQEIKSFNINAKEDNDYSVFYKKAVDDIVSKMENLKND